MSPHQTSASQVFQGQNGGEELSRASHSTMPPPMPVEEDCQGAQLPTSHHVDKPGYIHGDALRRVPAASPHIKRPQSTLSAPMTPAPTTSDVHNRMNRSNSECSNACSTSSAESSPRPSGTPACSKEIMTRFLKIDTEQSPLAYLSSMAIKAGVVQDGEDMYARRCQEEAQSAQSWSDSCSSRTLGRSEEGAKLVAVSADEEA